MLKRAIKQINKPCSPALYVGEFCSLMLLFGVSIVASTICLAGPLVFYHYFSKPLSWWKPMSCSATIILHVVLVIGLIVSKKYAGQIILDLGRSRSRKVIVFGVTLGCMLWGIWGEIQLRSTHIEERFWGTHLLEFLFHYPLSVLVCGCLAVLILIGRLENQLRERGVWISFRLLEWQRLKSYQWIKAGKPEKDDYVELHLRTDSLIPFLCRGIIEVHDNRKAEVDQVLRRYGITESENSWKAPKN